MNTARFDADLVSALKDPTGQYWSADDRSRALYRAIREYSRYRENSRLLGTGELASDAAIGSTSLAVIGGVFTAGSSITIDSFGSSETVIVQSVLSSNLTTGPDSVQTLTLTAPTTKAHSMGAFLRSSVTGLVMTANVADYALPLDFKEIDLDTLNRALGMDGRVRNANTYYDAIYSMSYQRSGVGYGQRQNFQGWYPPYTVGPAISTIINGFGGDVTFRFVGGTPPRMQLFPPPQIAVTFQDIWYKCPHTASSVLDSDSELILLYAIYTSVMSLANKASSGVNFKEKDVEVDRAKHADSLRQTAANALSEWEKRLRFRPFAVSG